MKTNKLFRDKQILIVVPARGGSKGIRLKNIRCVAGKPLIAYTAELIHKLPFDSVAIVSTDHPEIARIAMNVGLQAPFFRPANLSGDYVGDWDVLDHALRYIENRDGHDIDIVLMLQPTSPIRSVSTIVAVITKLIEGEFDAVWTVSITDSRYHPQKQLHIVDGMLAFYDSEGPKIVARQQLEPVYHRNGVAYAMTRDCIIHQKSLFGRRSSAVVVDECSVNIDDEMDIHMFEQYTKRQSINRK